MLDIVFLSYDEPNADVNFKRLKDRFPHATRVHGIKGIANAHIAAAKAANTRFFYVVDADAEVYADFDFSYKPTEYEKDYVHIWSAFNPAIGTDYGYGGVKLFSKAFFKNVTSQLDFSTSLTKDIKLMPQIACTTRFNSDELRAFRGAFREVSKLYVTSTNKKLPEYQRDEARERLSLWLSPLKSCEYYEFVLSGAQAALTEVKERIENNDLMFINDHDLINKKLIDCNPKLDLERDPWKALEGNPMKHEFFFTTRIASALYDPYVLDKLPVTELRDAISDGQLLSKNWLVDKCAELGLLNDSPRIVVLGGWIGTLALMFNCRDTCKVTSVDLDARANTIAQKLNYDFEFNTLQEDMYAIDYSQYDIIINTSSEHIPDIKSWAKRIPSGKIVVVQNNNYLEGDGHISCVSSVDKLKTELAPTDVLYSGTRTFPQYSRYMVIGRM